MVAFTYDALGRRLTKSAGGTATRFIYDGQSVIEEYQYVDSAWVLDAKFVHGNTACCLDEGSAFVGAARCFGPPASDNVLSLERKDGETWPRWYYLHDALGSVTDLLDEDGALSQAYEYDAWGNATIYDPDHASGNTYLYTGREWDAEIALYYYRARYYDPTNGRFTQADPTGYAVGAHLYVYVSARPTTQVDPLGLWNEDIHKGLTARLAEWAGFSDPRQIGIWAYAPDTDERAAVPAFAQYWEEVADANMLIANWNWNPFADPGDLELGYMFLDAAAEKLAEASKWHFPLSGNGMVEGGSAAARAFYEEGIRECDLQKFAEGLHTLQDSWSHAGRPPLWLTGHSYERGGPLSCAADDVDLWHADVRATGLATYGAMTKFLEKCGDCIYSDQPIRKPDSTPMEPTEVERHLMRLYPGENKGVPVYRPYSPSPVGSPKVVVTDGKGGYVQPAM
ncbi:MAG: hypothetical protein JW889_05425 [Verrucomicrobia bacterium]|nr:hypothetical protein [Verrucomicrobiota bacterium]